MEMAGLSTAVMLAIAALLWFLYFVPSWIRRREYLATERTATRLQRTVRIMAEAAEAPVELHVEANAREAARAERLRLAQERELARRALRDAEEAAAHRAQIEADRRRATALLAADTVTAAHRRRRRGRRIAGLALLVALVVAGIQFVLMAATGIAAGAWVVLAACGGVAVASIATQRSLRARPTAAAADETERAPVVARTSAPAPRAAAPSRKWTPQPLPRPRYLEHPHAAPLGPALGAPTMDAAAQLRVAAAAAAIPEPQLATLVSRTAPTDATGAASPYADMGHLGDLRESVDLDEVLARRRRVG